jgi:hypothetical protein
VGAAYPGASEAHGGGKETRSCGSESHGNREEGTASLSREKEKEMRNIFRIIGVSLASMAGILLVSGVAWAQASHEPVSGFTDNNVITDRGEIWDDEEGIRHIRNRRARTRFHGDIVGQVFRILDLNLQYSPILTGELDGHGSFSFVGFVLGDQVTATGRFSILCGGEPSICEEHSIWHLDDGRKINLTEWWLFFNSAIGEYEGVLLDPPGRR